MLTQIFLDQESMLLCGIGSYSVTGEGDAETPEPIETYEENEWLGDQESNLGSQNQNLLSCP